MVERSDCRSELSTRSITDPPRPSANPPPPVTLMRRKVQDIAAYTDARWSDQFVRERASSSDDGERSRPMASASGVSIGGSSQGLRDKSQIRSLRRGP
jgi:hypothetical protein